MIVTKLNDVRDDATVYNNRLDTLLADVFSLLSLFFLTIGKTNEAPATYSQLASMRVSMFYINKRSESCPRIGRWRTLLYRIRCALFRFHTAMGLHISNNLAQLHPLTFSFSKFSTIWMNLLSTTKLTWPLSVDG